LQDERYQNNGILKHFEYDSVITGTSMTQNFSASEFDALFDCQSIKVCNSGGSYKEMHDRLQTGFSSNNSIKYVIWGLDYSFLLSDKDTMGYSDLPEHLYNDSFFDDYKYLLSKDALVLSIKCLIDTILHLEPTSFDDYSYWADNYSFGKKIVDRTYTRSETKDVDHPFTDSDYVVLFENLSQNILSLAKANPQTEFFIFFPPYSIYYFDGLNNSGKLQRQLMAEKKAIEMLLQYDNVHLFSFFDEFEMITNLENYKDATHYGPWINSYILKSLKERNHELTMDNYIEYCNSVREFYSNYDYDRLFIKN
jgi:hypothetical protein